MKYINLCISLFFCANLTFSQQNIISCNKGLDNYAWGLYNDTILKKLIVLGYFNYADNIKVNGLATWDGNKFDTLGNNNILKYCLGGRREPIISYKNKLYFQLYDYFLYTYDYSTKLITKIPYKFDNTINDFCIHNNELVIVGLFEKVGTLNAHNIIKYNGSTFDSITKPDFSFSIYCVESFQNELYIGGNFDSFKPFNGVAKFTNNVWVKINPAYTFTGASQMVWDLKTYNNNLFLTGNWQGINGSLNQSSFAKWDGFKLENIGNFKFNGEIPAAISTLEVYNNKLYVIGGFDKVNDINTKNIAVYNDTIWCGVKMISNFGIQNVAVTNFKNNWYFVGGTTMIADTIQYTQTTVPDTVNYLGKYIGNNGRLERGCFDKTTDMIVDNEPFLPQGISINGDGINDELIIKLANTQSATLQVFNRWGSQVYKTIETNNSPNILLKWNSTFKNQQVPTGTYFYLIEATLTDGSRKVYKQFVQVVY